MRDFFFFLFLLFKEKMIMLLSGYRLSMGNNIDIVVVQRNTPHNKINIALGKSHIARYRLLYYLLYYFRNSIYAMLALLNSFHITVQALKIKMSVLY